MTTKASKILVVLLLIIGNYAFAQTTHTVNAGGGADFTTISAAISAASSGDIILVQGTITGDASNQDGIVVNKDLTIKGQGIGSTIVQASLTESDGLINSRVFTINAGSVVKIEDMTIRHGYLNTAINYDGGGGIKNSGNLTVENCLITRNHVHTHTYQFGGGILTADAGTTRIENSTISYNTSSGWAGGICHGNYGGPGPIELSNSTIHDNSAPGRAGAFLLMICSQDNIITNCTFYNNSSGSYGVLFNDRSSATYTNNTFLNNTCTGGGGGIYLYAGTMTMKNNLLANNNESGGTPNDFRYQSGTVNDNGYNLIEHSANYTFTGTGDITGDQTNLNISSSLADNSTFNNTQTLALLSGSVAIDAGNTGANGSVTVPCDDQRGYFDNGSKDIGAYEFNGSTVSPIITINTQPQSVSVCEGESTTLTTSSSNGIYFQWVKNNIEVNGADAASLNLNNVTLSDTGQYFCIVSDGCVSKNTDTVSVVVTSISLSLNIDSNATCNGSADGGLTASATNGSLPYFYSWVDNEVYTSDLTTGGTASANSSVSPYTPDKTFDNAITVWRSANQNNNWLKYDFGAGNEKTITRYQVQNGSWTGPNNWIFQGSNNNSTWINLDTITSQIWSDGQVKTFLINNTNEYRYYRLGNLNFNSQPAGRYDLREFNMFEEISNPSLTGLSAGIYTVEVTDGNGCSATASATITEPNTLVASTIVDGNVTCNGFSDGGATASASGGTAGYSYLWSNNDTSASITGIAAGTYTVTITDANGCTATTSETITEPAPILVTTNSDTVCYGGNVKLGASSTAGNYRWYNSAAPSTVIFEGDSLSLTNVTANASYEVEAYNLSTEVFGPTTAPTGSYLDNNPGRGTGFDVNISEVRIDSVTIYPSGAGWIIMHVGNYDGSTIFQSTDTIFITGTNNLTKTRIPVNLTIPQGVGIYKMLMSYNGITGMGRNSQTYPFNSSNNEISIIGGATGTGTPTSSNNYWFYDWRISIPGCVSSRATANVVVNPALVANVSVDSNVTCNGFSDGGLSTTASGADYLWSNSGTTASITGVSAGTYTVTVTDTNGCVATGSATITEPTSLVAALAIDSNVTCNGASEGGATASATGGTTPYFSYLWSNSATSTSITGVAAGNYTVTITDANGCTSSTSATITEPTALVAAAIVDSNVTCNGLSDGGATASASGGTTPYFSYLWSNSATTASITGIAAGIYTVTITDANGCTSSTSVTITEPTTLISTAVVDSNVSCNGLSDGGATASATGGTTPYFSYLWSNSATTASITGLAAGTYTVTITDANGCTSSTSTTITEPTTLVASAVVDSNVSCNGFSDGGATASATGGTTGYTYLWSNGATTASITGVTSGAYTATITDANGCTSTASVTITEPTALVASASVDSNVTCNGYSDGGATASANGGTSGYTYLWSNSAITPSITGVAAGAYTATVTDANGCTSTTSATITEPTALVASASVDSNVTCNGYSDGGATASANGGTSGYTYLWSNSAITPSITGVTAGAYTATVTDANGCTSTTSATITEPAAILVTTNSDTVCYGGNLKLGASSTAGNYRWYNSAAPNDVIFKGDSLSLSNVTADASYEVEAFDYTSEVFGPTTAPTGSYLDNNPGRGTGFDVNIPEVRIDSVTIYPIGSGWIVLHVADYSGTNIYQSSDTIFITGNNNLTKTRIPVNLSVSQGVGIYKMVMTYNGITGMGRNTQSYPFNSSNNEISIIGGATGTGNPTSSNNYWFYDWRVSIPKCTSNRATADVIVSYPFVASVTVDSNVTCNGGSDAGLSASGIGGNGTLTYIWSNGASSASITGVKAGTYAVTITDIDSCRSSDNATVTEPSLITGTYSLTVCDNYTVPSGNATYSQTGIYNDTIPSSGVCDSVITIDLTVNYSNSSFGLDRITSCDSYTWTNGITYTSSNNVARDTFANVAGCDSIVVLELTILNSTSYTDQITACDSYMWIDGNTYTSSNNSATHTILNAAGCDSLITLDLTINYSNSSVDQVTACDSYTWVDGNTYTTNNNSATMTYTNSANCDSVVTLDLTINSSNGSTDQITACDSYTWIDGNTYSTSNNSATVVYTNALNCDSVVTLDLTILNTTFSADVIRACDSYTWTNGITYTQSNTTAKDTFTNAVGCDSIVSLSLVIINSSSSIDEVNVCNKSYTWTNGVTYTESNYTATDTLTNIVGCDSIVTLNLTVSIVSTDVTINDGTLNASENNATYTWVECSDSNWTVEATSQSFTPQENGSYKVIVDQNGCIDTSDCYTINTVGIDSYEPIENIKAYPNPTNGMVTIDLGNNTKSLNITINDVVGRNVYAKTDITGNRLDVDLFEAKSGIYFINIADNKGNSKVIKLIKY